MSGPITVIPPRQALVDERGNITRVWWLFLQEIFTRIGGSNAMTNVELETLFSSFSPPSDPVAADAMRAVDELRNELASTRSQLGDVLSRLDELTAQLAGINPTICPPALDVIEEILRRPIDTALESRVTQLEDRLA
jgi:hypothetical protein